MLNEKNVIRSDALIMILAFQRISTRRNNNADALDEPERHSGPFQAMTTSLHDIVVNHY